ncbi:MAG: DUF1667 domain-containing protein [Lachnospiraceae bacterium]|nr:DUF1667 domain-containing protein [Lachnospiraceae bacterium]
METKHLICINCPMGCPLTVEMNGEEVVRVKGNTCKRGEVYGRKEVTFPTRMITSTVRVVDGISSVVSVKTREAIPKGKIFDGMKELKGIKIKAPIQIGDVILANLADTGIDVIATKNVEKR